MAQHTFEEVKKLANQLDFIFTSSPSGCAFDMDKRTDETIGGTWVNTPQGVENAYQYLVNYQQSNIDTPYHSQ